MGIGWLIVAGGVFGICGAVFDWEWFMNHRKAQALIRLFGRNGTRIFYVILGIALVVLGILLAMGVIQESK